MTNKSSKCVFCSIIRGQSPASIVYEGTDVLAIMDIAPVNLGHVLVFPKEHIPSLEALAEEIALDRFRASLDIARALRQSDIKCDGLTS